MINPVRTKIMKIRIHNEEELGGIYASGQFDKVLMIKGSYKDLGPARNSTIFIECPETTMIAFKESIFEVTEVTREEYLEHQSKTNKG